MSNGKEIRNDARGERIPYGDGKQPLAMSIAGELMAQNMLDVSCVQASFVIERVLTAEEGVSAYARLATKLVRWGAQLSRLQRAAKAVCDEYWSKEGGIKTTDEKSAAALVALRDTAARQASQPIMQLTGPDGLTIANGVNAPSHASGEHEGVTLFDEMEAIGDSIMLDLGIPPENSIARPIVMKGLKSLAGLAQQAMASTDIGRLRCFREGTGASAEEVAGNPNLDENARALAREYLAIQQAMAEKAAQLQKAAEKALNYLDDGNYGEDCELADIIDGLRRSLAGAEPDSVPNKENE